MIGLALSGGGSRAMAFHLGCLRALKDVGILDRVDVLSTISGGSVVGAYYAYTPDKSFTDFEADIQRFLKSGFQRSVALRFLRPSRMLACMASSTITHISEAIAATTGHEPSSPRAFSRTDLLHEVLDRDVYRGLTLSSPRRNDMAVVIGACDLRHGTAFRFGEQLSGSWRRGRLVSNQLDIAFAVTASAAYPIFLPALDRTWTFSKDDVESEQRVCLTDGGVYDNLGIQVLEPNRDAKYSLHTFPCKYIIACNAGQGREAGDEIPLGFYRRVKRSFGIVHRRVQDSAMNRLHYLRTAGAIKGFVMPYLGQLDDRVTWIPGEHVARKDVIGYPTNFGAMTEEWIERLSMRGEQLTRQLISEYLPELI
jgi:NTE family protein